MSVASKLVSNNCIACRYDHFKDKPAALLVKMAEFIMAALTDYVNKQYCDAVYDQHRLPESKHNPTMK